MRPKGWRLDLDKLRFKIKACNKSLEQLGTGNVVEFPLLAILQITTVHFSPFQAWINCQKPNGLLRKKSDKTITMVSSEPTAYD